MTARLAEVLEAAAIIRVAAAVAKVEAKCAERTKVNGCLTREDYRFLALLKDLQRTHGLIVQAAQTIRHTEALTVGAAS